MKAGCLTIRAMKVMDHLVIAVATNAGKGPMFDVDERVNLVQEALHGVDQTNCTVEVQPFDNLLMHFADRPGAHMLVRGLRAVPDFKYEFQMAGMNARLNPAD